MSRSNRLLILSQPVLTEIGEAAIERAIPSAGRPNSLEIVEITPTRTALREEYDLEWGLLDQEQERLFREKVRPYLNAREHLAYFGMAPVPLAIHLGYLVQATTKVDVYQRHHGRQDWAWPKSRSASRRVVLDPIRLPEQGSTAMGEAVIRVSVSAKIAREDTACVIPQCMVEVDIALALPDPDALETPEALNSVASEFDFVLARLRNLFPNLTAIHLFAAVPVGLAFRLGTRINPTMNAEVITYQFDRKRSPPYRRAIVLGAIPEAKLVPSPKHEWRRKELLTGPRPTFLDICFLEKGLLFAQSVVRIVVAFRPGKQGLGTGFLIAPDTILTNHHVLHDHDANDFRATSVAIQFNYELDSHGNRCVIDQYEGDVATIVGDKLHDWAIVRSREPFKSSYPILKLSTRHLVVAGDPVFIVQHPEGQEKKIGLTHNEVVDVTPDCIQYETDTLPGSSGAPVCDRQWQVIALHYAGVPADAANDQKLRNEGIRIERVVEGLKARGILIETERKA